MGAGVQLWGWDNTNKVWVKVLVNAAGKLIIDPTEIFEEPPTNGEMGKAATSNWSFDHDADPDAHHARLHTMTDVLDHSGRIALSQMTLGGAGLVLTGQGAGDPVYAAVAGATKQFFVPVFNGVGGLWAAGSCYSAYQLDSNGDYALMSFRLPADFTSLTSVKVITIPYTTGSFDWTADTQFGANGEAYNANTDSATADNQPATSLQLLELDISAAFTAVAANDIVGLRFTLDVLHTTTNLSIIGLDVKYA